MSEYLFSEPHPGHEDGKDGNRRKGEDHQDPHIDVGDLQRGVEGDHDKGDEHGDENQRGGKVVQRLVHLGRGENFLPQELEHVGNGLDETEGSHFLGTDPPLHMPGDLPLRPGQQKGVDDHKRQNPDKTDDHLARIRARHIEQFVYHSQTHLSISGITRSRLPRMATASARRTPWASSGKIIRLEKEGTRHFIRKGLSLSSLTM